MLNDCQHSVANTVNAPPTLSRIAADRWLVSGSWTALTMGDPTNRLPERALSINPTTNSVASVAITTPQTLELDGSQLTALDSAGALLLSRWLGANAVTAKLVQWTDPMKSLMALTAEHQPLAITPVARAKLLEDIGRSAWASMQESLALLAFIGKNAVVALRLLARPLSIRWRTVFHNIQNDGFNALLIIGLTSFLLGIVIAYQGAGQLKNYGANIFVVDLVGYAMLREFAPLISAIIIAGRSGSAYAAQIGTMVVTDEVDALSTLAINPYELLVIPKIIGLSIALPLLTVFADITGVFGGMLMAQTKLDIGFAEFIDRFGREMHGATLFIGIGKSFVFAIVIALIGCFQGFRAKGGADSVGRQTTRSVVQSIFLVIVIDAVFSIIFSILDL